MTDADLLAGCRLEDPLAQRALYDRYAGLLFGIAIRYVGRREVAEDVMTEAFVKIFKNLDQYDGEGSFQGWIRRIVTNEALMHLRKRRLDLVELDEVTDVQAGVDIHIDADLQTEDVMALLDVLPDGCRTVFNLYELEGYRHREIAEMLGVSINTSKSQLILAKRKLREAYERLANREGHHLRPIPKRS